MKKKILSILLVVLMVLSATGCASWDRATTDFKSEMSGGLERVINVYTADGELIATYEGKIDIEEGDSSVKFDLNGKRYIYYNCFVETIAEK